MLFIPLQTHSTKTILEYYVKTVSPTKKSHKTEIYRIKALSDLLGDVPFGGVTPAHVIAFRDQRLQTPHPRDPSKTLATSTVKLELMLLSHVFSTAIAEWGMDTLINPILKVRKPKAPPGRARRLSDEEEKLVLGAAYKHVNREFYAIVVLALETAMRQGELLALRWENISWTKRTALLPTTKNGEIREVPLSKKAFDILQNYMPAKRDGKVFSYTTSGIKSTWRSFTKSIFLKDFHFHDLRHCAISNLVEKGLNSVEVAAISGHKSMSMLKRYSHLYAYKLVRKLDPVSRPKKKRYLLRENLPDFPAIVTNLSRSVVVTFPDFVDARITSTEEDRALQNAETFLLQRLVSMHCNGEKPPVPSPKDLVLLRSSKSKIVMISPLAHESR